MTLTASVVEFVKLIVFAWVIAPVEEFINSTCGIFEKFVPVILIVVAVAGAIVCETFAIVGFVSTASIKLKTPDPFVDKTCPLDPVLFGKVKVYVAPAECGGA